MAKSRATSPATNPEEPKGITGQTITTSTFNDVVDAYMRQYTNQPGFVTTTTTGTATTGDGRVFPYTGTSIPFTGNPALWPDIGLAGLEPPSWVQQGEPKTAKQILEDERDAVQELLGKLAPPEKSVPAVGEMPDGYLELAQRLGMDGPQLVRARVLGMLQREELVVYGQKAVYEYLDSMCKALTEVAKPRSPKGWGRTAAVVWKWVPLQATSFFSMSKPSIGYCYSEVVPVEALRVMDRVLSAMPGAGLNPKDFGWQVSEVSEYPDPFLALVWLGEQEERRLGPGDPNRWVLAHWAEPGFSILK